MNKCISKLNYSFHGKLVVNGFQWHFSPGIYVLITLTEYFDVLYLIWGVSMDDIISKFELITDECRPISEKKLQNRNAKDMCEAIHQFISNFTFTIQAYPLNVGLLLYLLFVMVQSSLVLHFKPLNMM